MPITVNGEMLPEAFIEMERERLASHPDFRQIADARERETRLRKAAEETAINRMLMAQAAARDPRPVREQEIQRECDSFRARNGDHVTFDADVLRVQCEARLRLRRTVGDIRNAAPAPSEESVFATYERYKDTFEQPEQVHAAQVVKHTAEGLQEEAARIGIAEALAELERGIPFAEVADRLSDCAGKGGDIGWFGRGAMVQEFEDVVFALKPGARSGIFRSELGYHIALVLERREAGRMEFGEAKI